MAALAEKSSWCCTVEQIQSSESGPEPAEVAGVAGVAGVDAEPGERKRGDMTHICLKQTEDVLKNFVPFLSIFTSIYSA